MFTFSTTTGQLFNGSQYLATGYSGFGAGKLNPEMENVANVGPLPRGTYTMEIIKGEDGLPCDYEGKKKPVIRLVPSSTNEMFGRAGFLMHGDSISDPGTASHGCVIEDHGTREVVANAITEGNNTLEVV